MGYFLGSDTQQMKRQEQQNYREGMIFSFFGIGLMYINIIEYYCEFFVLKLKVIMSWKKKV